MKKNNQNIKDLISVILLFTSIVLLVNPFDLIMAGSLQMLLLAGVSLVVIAILIFQWRENPMDEREETHLLIAGRISFFSISIVLLIALIIQTFQHQIDPWIPISLLVLLISKILALQYLRIRK